MTINPARIVRNRCAQARRDERQRAADDLLKARADLTGFAGCKQARAAVGQVANEVRRGAR